MEEKPSYQIGDYELLEHIGSGSFADVFKGMHLLTKCPVAIKVVSKSSLEKNDNYRFFNEEIELCRKFDHPFIANYYESFEDEKNHYISMEFLPNGDLLDEVNKKRGLNERQAHKYFCQLISALEYLHSELHIIHRDIKAENIMLDKYKNIRLADFGLSKQFTTENPFRETLCGSPAYAAPEMIRNQPYTAMADIWSSGVLLYALLCGVLPFNSDNTTVVMHQIVYQDPIYPLFLSENCRDLLKRLLTKDWRQRITLQQIKEHPWIIGHKNSINISYDFGASFSLNGFHGKIIDHAITKKLRRLGYEIDGLATELVTNMPTTRVAAYKMLRRKRIAKLIFTWLHEKLPTSKNMLVPPIAPSIQQLTERAKLGSSKLSVLKSAGYGTIKRPPAKIIQPNVHFTAPVSPPEQFRRAPLSPY